MNILHCTIKEANNKCNNKLHDSAKKIFNPPNVDARVRRALVREATKDILKVNHHHASLPPNVKFAKVIMLNSGFIRPENHFYMSPTCLGANSK